MRWQDRIIIDPHVLVGKPIIKGTRIAVEFVIDLLGRGWTQEQILAEYDHVTREDIQAEFKEKSKGEQYKPYIPDGPPPLPKD